MVLTFDNPYCLFNIREECFCRDMEVCFQALNKEDEVSGRIYISLHVNSE